MAVPAKVSKYAQKIGKLGGRPKKENLASIGDNTIKTRQASSGRSR